MELDKAIDARHSAKNFKEKIKPNYRDIIEAIEAGTKSPLAGNIPSIKFILVSDKNKITKLAEYAEQDIIAKAHYVVVVCTDKTRLEKYYFERASTYSRQQAGAAIENFLLKIEDLGLATTWIGAFAEDLVQKELKIPKNIDVEAMFPIGYELDKNPKKRIKPDLAKVLYYDKWENKHMKPAKTFAFD